jgi:hypothetical protein
MEKGAVGGDRPAAETKGVRAKGGPNRVSWAGNEGSGPRAEARVHARGSCWAGTVSGLVLSHGCSDYYSCKKEAKDDVDMQEETKKNARTARASRITPCT